MSPDSRPETRRTRVYLWVICRIAKKTAILQPPAPELQEQALQHTLLASPVNEHGALDYFGPSRSCYQMQMTLHF
ncbi:hypothetical protein DPMN_090758 [Dreissena polymorpha]|uniref:Uncharacterized protein n=1 Tax=Dreissena polymorpha TaxID=45954 RepID=A0A9D4L0C8_DREPO|nr:hypothetical protein DPMN_090758 [Dreissena polymorpha]